MCYSFFLPRRRDAPRLSSIGDWQSRAGLSHMSRLGLNNFTYNKTWAHSSIVPRCRRSPRSLAACSTTTTLRTCHSLWGLLSYSLSSLAGMSEVIRRSGHSLFISLICHSLTMLNRFQLDAIPTIGYSDPIRSYLSAFRFYFDGVPMLKEGYAKVICIIPYIPSLY